MRNQMRRRLGTVALLMIVAGTVGASAGEDDNNEVRCDGGIRVPTTDFWLTYDFLEGDGSGRTVEGCGDGDAPLQGRIYVTDEDGGAIGLDGERDTPFAHGWVRINGNGTVTCYDGNYAGGHSDSKRNEGNFQGLDCPFLLIQ